VQTPARVSDNKKNSEGVTEHPRICHSFVFFDPLSQKKKPGLSRNGENPETVLAISCWLWSYSEMVTHYILRFY